MLFASVLDPMMIIGMYASPRNDREETCALFASRDDVCPTGCTSQTTRKRPSENGSQNKRKRQRKFDKFREFRRSVAPERARFKFARSEAQFWRTFSDSLDFFFGTFFCIKAEESTPLLISSGRASGIEGVRRNQLQLGFATRIDSGFPFSTVGMFLSFGLSQKKGTERKAQDCRKIAAKTDAPLAAPLKLPGLDGSSPSGPARSQWRGR